MSIDTLTISELNALSIAELDGLLVLPGFRTWFIQPQLTGSE